MTWRSSSYSDDVNCVQVRGDLTAVRDSKDVRGQALKAPAFRAFVQNVKAGRFDR